MPALSFAKYQGLGNDFIILDHRARPALLTPEAAARLCDRRRGIGADGVLTLLPARSAEAFARMHIFNADGSVAEMCGNGLRCVVAALSTDGSRSLGIDTDAGPREGRVLPDGRVRVSLGMARLIADGLEAELGDERRAGVAVSMGNPHLVLAPWREPAPLAALAERFGPALEHHARFPARTNVEFVRLAGARRLEVVVFERGSGITLACGTGAAASVAAARRAGLLAPGPVDVVLPGGVLEVELGEAGVGAELGLAYITGDAARAFSGEVHLIPGELRAP